MIYFDLQAVYRGIRKNRYGYTLIELAITLGVILILSSIAIFAYQRFLGTARSTVCKTNLKALKEAIEKYVLENDALPATLGQLKLRHLEEGYAKAMEDRGWVTEFSLFLIKLDDTGNANAQYLTYENLKKYGVSENIFHCPGDRNQGVSYAMNKELEGKKWSEIDRDVIVVADCDNYVFTSPDQFAKRHTQKALAIKVSGQILELSDTDTDKVICHKPGTPAEKTMVIPASALDAHLAHGDSLGPCP
jgi:prepilin-type N-terminal cleavage/methylation domain-containing protein